MPVNKGFLEDLGGSVGQSNYWYPDRESNSELSFRRALLYPFNYQGNIFVGAKVVQNERKTKLMGDFLLKRVKMRLSVRAITEQSCADALPIASTHGEGLAS